MSSNKSCNAIRLGGLGLNANASIENTTKAVAVTAGAISHTDTVARSSVPEWYEHGSNDKQQQYLIIKVMKGLRISGQTWSSRGRSWECRKFKHGKQHS